MDTTILKKIGLTESQARVYLALVENGELTPPTIAEISGENRTNTYMILDKLVSLGVVERREEGKLRYVAHNPSRLRRILEKQKAEVRAADSALKEALPGLLSLFRESHNQPGVTFHEGIEGIKTIYAQILEEKQDISIFPSTAGRSIPDVEQMVEKNINKQIEAGISTRALYPESYRKQTDVNELSRQSIHIKFWQIEPFEAQVLMFGNSVAITTFNVGVYSTLIDSPIIAHTLKAIFAAGWTVAQD